MMSTKSDVSGFGVTNIVVSIAVSFAKTSMHERSLQLGDTLVKASMCGYRVLTISTVSRLTLRQAHP
jgi:hypothetical protein